MGRNEAKTIPGRSGGKAESNGPGRGSRAVTPHSRLVRTSVYKRVPACVRRRLDRAILLRPEDCRTLSAIFGKFRLAQRFEITERALRTYARRLEQLVAPVFAGHLLASVLGCLPPAYRQQLTSGGQVIVISRLLDCLTDKKAQLPVSELAKMATVLKESPAPRNATSCRKETCARKTKQPGPGSGTAPESEQPDDLARAVRMVYGLDCSTGQKAKSTNHSPDFVPKAK